MATNRDFAHLCGNENVVVFAKRAITQTYCDRIPHHGDELRVMIDTIFRKLVTCRHSEAEFTAALRHAQTEILHTDNPDFWFTQAYRRYKRKVKPALRFSVVEPWLTGGRILDFGGGDGALAGLFHRLGYQVTLADVLDYRTTDALAVPFVQMITPGMVPFADQSFDTALVLLTLHHVDPADLPSVLSGLRRATRRTVVEEECYALPSNLAGSAAALAGDAFFWDFTALSPSDQLDYLMFVDYFANIVVGGFDQMNLPFQFKTVDDWQAVFTRQGFAVTQILPVGFQAAYFHRSCCVWFVLDS